MKLEQEVAAEEGKFRLGETGLKIGDNISVFGLAVKPQHNGKRGVVVGFQESSKGSRVQVRLQDQGCTELALKLANLARVGGGVNKCVGDKIPFSHTRFSWMSDAPIPIGHTRFSWCSSGGEILASAEPEVQTQLRMTLAEKLSEKAGTPIPITAGIASSPALLESQLLPMSFARTYWASRHNKVGCDELPPGDATVPLRAVRESFMECLGFWPTASHPNPNILRYQHTKDHALAEAVTVNEIEFCLFCLAADEDDIKNPAESDAFPPVGYVSLAGIPWEEDDFTNPW